jgi:transketolase
MRQTFANYINELAERDERIVVLSGDIGNRMFDNFKERYPDRFYNCGVAEANMIGVAAGLAMDGLRPFVYTIAPFLTSRCYEQIKVDLCYHCLPVTLVGVGGGLSYAELGPTHHSFEDLAILRVLPNMVILTPADSLEVSDCMDAVLNQDNPCYIRLGKKGEPVLHREKPGVGPGKTALLRDGKHICLLAAGPIAQDVLAAGELLRQHGLEPKIISCTSVKPLDERLLTQWTEGGQLIVTIEEHSRIGGLGTAVAEWCNEHDSKATLLRLGLADQFYCDGGHQSKARQVCGLGGQEIAAAVLTAWRKIHNGGVG